jgi:hypothetical protein
MNNTRRKALSEISRTIFEAKAGLVIIAGDEGEYRDNMPENLQSSERYAKADEAYDVLCEAIGYLEDAIECIAVAEQ